MLSHILSLCFSVKIVGENSQTGTLQFSTGNNTTMRELTSAQSVLKDSSKLPVFRGTCGHILGKNLMHASFAKEGFHK